MASTMMVPKVMVLLADGFEEVEFVTPVDILRRAGVDVICASIYDHTSVLGAHDIPVSADCLANDVDLSQVDCLLLPGGGPGTNNLMNSALVLEIVRKCNEAGKLIAAICAAPKVLKAAGILADKEVTSYPATREQLENDVAKYREDRVVIDGNIVTSRGAGTSADFSFAILEMLDLPIKAQEICKAMLYNL